MTPKELEEASFRNLVFFYKDELTEIINGALASDMFTENKHTYLLKYGVIARVQNTKYTKPTLKAMEILKNIGSE